MSRAVGGGAARVANPRLATWAQGCGPAGGAEVGNPTRYEAARAAASPALPGPALPGGALPAQREGGRKGGWVGLAASVHSPLGIEIGME